VSENGGFFVPQAFFHGENDEKNQWIATSF
jgi:hypothetical protein